MNVVMIFPFHSNEAGDPDVMLDRYPILSCLPAEMAKSGHRVTVLAHAAEDRVVEQDGAHIEFVRPGRLAFMAGRAIHRRKPRYGPAYYQPAMRLLRRLDELEPDVIHFFGLTMDIQLALVVRRARRKRIPLIAHFHGGLPATSGRLRLLQRHNLRRLARVLFTTGQQSDMWLRGGVGLRAEQVAHVLETSSPFSGLEREDARRNTGMHGDPVYLSAGRLHPVKDPLTLLRGFDLMRQAQPGARLYMHYLSDELIDEVRGFLSERSGLGEAVELHGRVPLEAMEAVYSSADFLLQASLREWSGLAVLEAMSCGCIPIVTNIPAFAMMTNDGAVGRLFEPGDARGLASAALGIDAAERVRLRVEMRRHFDERLSFPALARDIDSVYREVVDASRF